MPKSGQPFFPRPPAPERVQDDTEQLSAQRHWSVLTGPPRLELGDLFAIRQVVSQGPDHAIAILDGATYSTGLSFRVALFSRKVEGHREASARIALVVGERIVEANGFDDSGLREMPPAPQLASHNPCGAWGPLFPDCSIRVPGDLVTDRFSYSRSGLVGRGRTVSRVLYLGVHTTHPEYETTPNDTP